MLWNNIPKSWQEALGPILFDIGDDKLIYYNGNENVCGGLAIVSKTEFLKNPERFITNEVEECYGYDSSL